MKQSNNIITKDTTSEVVHFKQWILTIININIWSLQLKSSKLLHIIGVPKTVSLILTGIHKKKRHYNHQYEIGIWKYVLILY